MTTISGLKKNECVIEIDSNLITFISRDISRNFNSIKDAEKEAKEYNLKVTYITR